MKKRILSILTALVLCLTLLPTAALAEGTTTLQGSGTADNPWELSSINVFAEKTEETTPTVPYKKSASTGVEGEYDYHLPAGHYKLTGDISGIGITILGNVTLDLNGKPLTGPNNSPAIKVGYDDDSPGNLTLKDSKGGTGGVTGNKVIYVHYGSLELVSGTVSCTSDISHNCAICVSGGTTVTLKGGTVSALRGAKAISMSYSGNNQYATLCADGGTVNGLVENDHGIITHSAGVTTATNFTGPVQNGGTISGGTFNGTVTNLAYNNKYGTLDNSSGTIINNGVFVFQSGYKNGETEITADNASTFISGLNLSGTGYVDIQRESGSDTTHSYYSHSGTSITNPDTKATVTFDLNGGTGTIPPQGIYDGGKAAKPTDPARDGYTFGGWYKEADCTNEWSFSSYAVTNDTTLYAKWKPIYTVTFDPNGGTVDPASATTDIDGKLTELPTPTRSGSYRFDGWFTEQNGGTAVTVDTAFTANTTVYAHWTYTGGSSRPSYAITVPDTEHGTVKVSPRYAQRGDTVTITVTPDEGYTLETLTVLDKNSQEIELTDKGDGKYTFKMPGGKVEVKATFMEDNSMLNFFVDVTADKYYYDAVLWAAKNGITGGVDENHFGPGLSCTRAQLVTFLWRTAGCPVVNYAMNFSDVGDDYYTEAVRWAASLGIVGGYGNGLFGSNDTITREQMATILYRFAQTQGNGFSGAWAFRLNFEDVSELSDWAVEGVSWCVMNDIMQGYDNNLMPKAECTRAQIVTMLYRLLGA